jgi:TPR repeat protein
VQARAAEDARRAAEQAQREAAAQQRRATAQATQEPPQGSPYALALAALRRADYAAAEASCKQGSANDDPACQNLIGSLYIDGKRGNRSVLELAVAAELIRRAAAKGLPGAQYNFAVLNERGIGMRQDMGAALNWYDKAARQGHPNAQRAVARLQGRQSGAAATSVQLMP